jgi:hypothetical protein
VVVIAVVVVLRLDHDRCAVMPMPVSHTDANATDADFDAFRDDYWFVAGVQRTSKYRHRHDRNKKKRKHSILHGTLFGWGRSSSRQWSECALGIHEFCIGLTSTFLETPMKVRGLDRCLSK